MAFWLIGAPSGRADVPRLLHYQGRLFLASTPVDGPGQFKFALVNGDGSHQFWANSPDLNGDGEPDMAVPLSVSHGAFAVFLGDASISNMAALPTDVFTADALYLRVWYSDGNRPFALLAPDQRLGAVAYALLAASVPDASITASKLAPGAIQASQIPNIDASKITSGQLDSGRLPPWLVDQAVAASTRFDNLQNQITTLGNQIGNFPQGNVPLPTGITRVSELPNDATLIGQGYELFSNIPAPGWQTGSSLNAPTSRRGHTGLWAGHSFLVWGGDAAGGVYLNSGAVYEPTDASWTAISPVDAPPGRTRHSAIWTGREMIVWGGYGGSFRNDGARFDPAAQRWTPLNTSGAPAERDGHVAVWTGSTMVIWGGRNSGGLRGDGGIWDRTADNWMPTPTLAAPTARKGATAVWTGSAMILWGGETTGGPGNTGGILFFSASGTPFWQVISTWNAPAGRRGHTAVWTGQKMIVWGGDNAGGMLADGGIYDPTSDTWSLLPAAAGSPSARTGHSAVWTGREMLVQGGAGVNGPLASGSAFNPSTDSWRALTLDGNPLPRTNATAAWTGMELLVFGGEAAGLPVAGFQRLNPQPAFYLYRKL